MSEQVLPITGLKIGEVPAAVLVCGDPARATKTAAYLEDAVLLSEQREYRAFRGTYQGTAVAVCSHGVGAAGAAVAFEELIAAGAKQIIRIGTCGGIKTDVTDGDLVIAASAIANIGYAREVVPPHFPAAADPELTVQLLNIARQHGHPHHMGMVITRDTFYGGVTTPFTPNYETLAQANVTAVEMECAALFIIGALRGVQTAAILTVDGNVLKAPESMDSYQPHRDVVAAAVQAEIEIALTTLTKT
ncbi:MAG: nucleoside phosphorylase [Anaerolineales bacterium]|nr:nucleoside phosphorylase [Anaerolineales bacterium]